MNYFDESNSYEEIINNINTGDNVSFRLSDFNLIKINGEVRNFYFYNDKLYIKVYDYFKREENTFILTKDLKFKNSKRLKTKKSSSLVNNINLSFDDINDDDFKTKRKNILIKIFSVIALITFLFTSIPDLKISLTPDSYTYRQLLSDKMPIYKLYNLVTSRITYKPDIHDEWMTPEYAWTMKSGDCEEYASIISDYLNHHNIKNYLVGMNIKRQAEGHAVVFAVIDNEYYIIDPTRAIEYSGIKKLNKINNLKDAILIYSTLPVSIYKIPQVNYEKEVIDNIY